MAQLDLLQKYKGNKKTFIETGTWQGDGILQSIRAGFDTIYTCDIDPDLVERAKDIYSYHPDLHVINNYSHLFLEEIMPKIDEECLVFLDAHIMPGKTGWEDSHRQIELCGGSTECPLVKEVDAISKSKIRTHTILIDDYGCFGSWVFNGLQFKTIQNMIMNINKDYKISIENEVACFYI